MAGQDQRKGPDPGSDKSPGQQKRTDQGRDRPCERQKGLPKERGHPGEGLGSRDAEGDEELEEITIRCAAHIEL